MLVLRLRTYEIHSERNHDLKTIFINEKCQNVLSTVIGYHPSRGVSWYRIDILKKISNLSFDEFWKSLTQWYDQRLLVKQIKLRVKYNDNLNV